MTSHTKWHCRISLQISMMVLLFSLCGCSNLLYFPSQDMFYDPAQLGLVPEEIFISVEEKIRVHGWYLKSKSKNPKGVIVFFHGNAQNLTSHYVSLSWIVREGYDYFIWDYRGYGKSQGSPTPKNTVEDGQKVIRHIYERNKNLPLFVFAQSLGGAIALRSVIDLKGEIPIKKMAVDSTFQSYQSISREVLSRGWLTWLFQPLAYVVMSDKYAPEDRIGEISPIPLLVMHGTKDQIVNYKFGEEVFKEAREPKEFWSIKDGQHIDSFYGKQAEATRKKFLDFLKRP